MSKVDPDNEATFKVIEIRSCLADAKKPGEIIFEEIARCGYDEDARFAIKLSFEEALSNAIRHGNCLDDSKKVVIKYSVTPRRVVISVCDQGDGFCPDSLPDPTSPDRLSYPSGRGVVLMRAYMTDVQYRCGGREVVMTKDNPNWPGDTESP